MEIIKQHLPDYAYEHLEKSKGKNQFVCPFCGSGTGTHATGALTVYPQNYYCFACQQHGDIFDLARQIEGIPQNQVIHYLADKYHLQTDKPNENQDYTSFFSGAHQHICETDYHRGISLPTLDYFNIGYVREWRHPKSPHSPATPRLIIPTSPNSYLARDTRDDAAIPENQRRYVKSKVGRVHIFNEKALHKGKIVYIAEGEIDALSIMDIAGYDCAVGLGSVSNVNSLFKVLDSNAESKKTKFIIASDNDHAGDRARNALIQGFTERNIACCIYDPCCGHKDPNEALMTEPEKFRAAVKYGMEQIDRLIEQQQVQNNTDKQSHYDNQFSAKVLLQDFVNGIADHVNTEMIPTGFKALDNVLDGGLYEGLYGIGAISSLGKTTFVLQMADQIAALGHEVLIFSLEMSRNELIAKSISRNTFQRALQSGNIRHAKTTRGIMTGKKYPDYSREEKELIQNSILDYEKIAGNVFIREGMGDVSAETIVQQVKEHIESGHKPPVVIVDYLQILSPKNERATDKQNTDNAILTFKRLSRDQKIPVIVISSFNRENYSTRVSMQAFKESGAIEYSTDVLIGLQLKGVGGKTFDVDKAKSREPREVEAVILKNRNGKTGGKICYDFHAMFNYFSESALPTEIDYEPELFPTFTQRL